jgi:hypothetical protein
MGKPHSAIGGEHNAIDGANDPVSEFGIICDSLYRGAEDTHFAIALVGVNLAKR